MKREASLKTAITEKEKAIRELSTVSTFVTTQRGVSIDLILLVFNINIIGSWSREEQSRRLYTPVY